MSILLIFLVLLLDFWAIVNLAQSAASTGTKFGWAVAIVVFPFAGLIVWYLAGPKAKVAFG